MREDEDRDGGWLTVLWLAVLALDVYFIVSHLS